MDIHVVDYGGCGETIILIHGLTANARFWDAIATRLMSNNRVIAFDLRGRGDSEKPFEGYDVMTHANDIQALYNRYGFEKATLIGHSLGAMIAVCFAGTYPEKVNKLVLIDGGEDLHPEVAQLLTPSIARLDKEYNSFSEYITALKNISFFQDWNDYVEQYFYADVHHLENGNVKPKALKMAIMAELDSLQKTSINDFHSTISAPTLILYAPHCLYHPSAYLISKEKGQQLAACLPCSRFVEIKEANHFSIVFSHYEKVTTEIQHFLLDKGVTHL